MTFSSQKNKVLEKNIEMAQQQQKRQSREEWVPLAQGGQNNQERKTTGKLRIVEKPAFDPSNASSSIYEGGDKTKTGPS